MKKAVILLGAGASADASNDAFRLNDPDLAPPVARGLFQGARFWEIASKHPKMQLMWSLLAPEAKAQTPFPLEERLSEFAAHPDPDIREAFKAVPLYLRDLLDAVSHTYLPIPEPTRSSSLSCSPIGRTSAPS